MKCIIWIIEFVSVLFLIFFILSCHNVEKQNTIALVEEWNGKTLIFPNNLNFTILGDSVAPLSMEKKKIVVYADSAGCMSCKLGLPKWKNMLQELDSIPVFFFLYSEDIKNIVNMLRQENFLYPVCIDVNDSFNKLNHLPSDIRFRTFLLDEDNKILVIGNPTSNFQIKDLYLKMISNNKFSKQKKEKLTVIQLNKNSIDLGKCNYDQEVVTEFVLANTGDVPLIVADVITSCGCISVEYEQEPIPPGESLKLIVKYRTDQLGYFDKSINVFCNIDKTPLLLKIMGEVLAI
ncbi:DUF1573 domain-containing protein [Bacteroides salyersiae]|jgi:hypothetical protein|uniref:DUF1573 domain-containing protein n=1 Tax=Bacteroides salyersiae TaxID=291644 RepID=UPI001C8B62A0|nr:DUF1573 domain-containing protein [Bacteroides salyersiae]